MKVRNALHLGVPALVIAAAMTSPALAAAAQDSPEAESSARVGGIEEIVVTAQKRAERVNDIGMSIQAIGSDDLTKLGVTDTADLSKITPGFNFTAGGFGMPIYTIRGIGFQDTSLAASPTVSLYVDEVPLPYSILTTGASLDLERVEVLKGPQGILFGNNATGGAINYIAAKPTDDFSVGAKISYGRFDSLDAEGFISGPISDNVGFRVAVRRQSMDDWQKGYTTPLTSGQRDVWIGRAMLEFEPTETFSALLSIHGWKDKSDTQVGQFFGVEPLNPTNGVDPRIIAYPLAPHNPRAADRSVCVNNSIFNEPFNQIPEPFGYSPDRPTTAENCTSLARDNTFYQFSLRMELELSPDIKLTSLSSYERFDRDQPVEGDGTIYQNYEAQTNGYLDVLYQELRLSGEFGNGGNWIVGANYERDKTFDNNLVAFSGSTSIPTLGINMGPTNTQNRQTTDTYAVFGNVQVPLSDQITVYGGLRYTSVKKDYIGCGYDGGDGTWAAISKLLQDYLADIYEYTPAGVDVGPFGCATTGPAPTYNPLPAGFPDELNEDNVSFRAGIDFKPVQDTLLYANVSRGYKAGVFPTVATSSFVQLEPARQEQLTAYEIGAKSTLFDRRLQLNGAVFYYDYKDKQILGALNDLVFGALPALVNVPKSDVKGFELSVVASPTPALQFSGGVSYAKSRVKGDYFDFDPFARLANFKGQPFPSAPPWSGFVDAQYNFPLGNLEGYVGGTVNYQDKTNSFFYVTDPEADPPGDILEQKARTLVDLRAGIEKDNWSLQIWGRNVFNKWYWNGAAHVNDVVARYTGMPATYGMTFSWKM